MTAATNSTQRDLDLVGILNYAFLATAYKSKKDDGTFRDVFKTSVLFEPSDPVLETIRVAQREIAAAAWGSDPTPWSNEDGSTAQIPEWQAQLLRFVAAGKGVIKNGNLADDPNSKGKLYITANFNPNPERGMIRPPCVATLSGAALQEAVAKALALNPATEWALTVKNQNLQAANVPLDPGHRFFPYSGCKALVKVSLYAQGPKGRPHNNGPRINVQLKGVQFLEHGKAFAGGGPKLARIEEFGIRPADADAAIPGAAQGAAGQPNLGAAGGLI